MLIVHAIIKYCLRFQSFQSGWSLSKCKNLILMMIERSIMGQERTWPRQRWYRARVLAKCSASLRLSHAMSGQTMRSSLAPRFTRHLWQSTYTIIKSHTFHQVNNKWWSSVFWQSIILTINHYLTLLGKKTDPLCPVCEELDTCLQFLGRSIKQRRGNYFVRPLLKSCKLWVNMEISVTFRLIKRHA